jgi:hypothetical protein
VCSRRLDGSHGSSPGRSCDDRVTRPPEHGLGDVAAARTWRGFGGVAGWRHGYHLTIGVFRSSSDPERTAARLLRLIGDDRLVDEFVDDLRSGDLPVDTMRAALSILAEYDAEVVATIACETLVQCSGTAALERH